MDVLDAIKKRRSCRAFQPGQLDEKQAAQLLEAAIWAPSAGNVQPWHFYLVRDSYLKTKLAEAALGQKFIAQAPLVIVVCTDVQRARASYQARGVELYCLQDTAAACQNMLLQATEMGLASCWVGAFDEKAVGSLLHIVPSHRPVALLCFGKSAEISRKPSRRPLAEVFTEVD
jgi:nitroreductase